MLTEIRSSIEKTIIGKRHVINLLLVALLAEGHIIIEDVPGIGKTTLAKAMAKTLNLKFSRIQFTPDVMPSDVLGVSIYNQKTKEFEFRHGPVRTNILLADEINRASPKTQSSLLEAMAEKQYTIDGNTYELETPFIVIATQNPIEFEGTFPLPEAQLDRFMIRINMGYPEFEQEIEILDKKNINIPIESVVSKDELMELVNKVKNIEVGMNIRKFIVNIANKTRNSEDIILPMSPRASQDLFRASKAYAFIRERDYVIPEDVIELAPYVVSHRIIVNPEVKFRGMNEYETIDTLVREIRIDINEKVGKK
ncbi:MAG: MoxR family ATPase [Clostridiales bacterium]|nr:MoxR family ATPase [Clostridiales bacterium]